MFDEYQQFIKEFAHVEVIPTPYFLGVPEVGEEFSIELERGKTLWVKLVAVGQLDKEGKREVFWELNGLPRSCKVINLNFVGPTLDSKF